jgi:HTH-type transcriptional regulator / antitoxin HigA
MTERVPAEVFPPGEFLQDELDKRGWSQVEFAEIIERSPNVVSEIIKGKRGITPESAREIAAALGTSPHYWLNLEAAYRLGTEAAPLRIKQSALLRTRFPMTREMVKRGWIKASDNPEELEANVLRFFRIADAESPRQLAHAAKRNDYAGDLTAQQEAWLYRVRELAERMPLTVKYSESKLRRSLDALHALTIAPEEARHVPRLLAECGVRFVIVEPLPASKIDGVCLWLKNEPVIGMTLRHNRIDNFWFVLRHECEHVLNGDGKNAPILDSDVDAESTDANVEIAGQEARANAAAQNFCVPVERLESFVRRKKPMISKKDVLFLAHELQVHPGIVAGQVRRRLRRWDLFSAMLVRVRDVVTPSAMTDGYGYAFPVPLTDG